MMLSRIPSSEPSSDSTMTQFGFRPCLRAQSESQLARSVLRHERAECCAPETRSLAARQLTPLFGLDHDAEMSGDQRENKAYPGLLAVKFSRCFPFDSGRPLWAWVHTWDSLITSTAIRISEKPYLFPTPTFQSRGHHSNHGQYQDKRLPHRSRNEVRGEEEETR